MIAAIYARKSTEQLVAADARSVTRQVDGAKVFVISKGWTLDDHHIYVDDGVSGALFAGRPAYQHLLRDAAAGAFDALAFFDLDRLGRDGHKVMVALNALADFGVSLWDSSTGRQIELDTFENRLPTVLKAEFAQQYREQIRKHTRAAMRQKAEMGYVTGGKVFGYDNVRVAKGQTTREINETEAAVVRDIYQRFADGEGLRTIALALNRNKAPSPRAQQGRANGWSSSSVRAVLERPLYRGEVIFGRTAKAYGRELGKRSTREKGQVPTSEATWIRRDAANLRIVDADLAARVDRRRTHWRQKAHASKAKGRAPQNASGKYLLSGGMLICPTCGGHFEAFKSPWKTDGIYVCATRRRKPGTCTNTLALSIAETDDAVLEMVEGEVLGTRFIEELLASVDAAPDLTQYLQVERDALSREISNLMDLAASGVSADTIAPKVRERQARIAVLDVQLRTPRPAPPNIERLRDALNQRAEQWKAELRAEPKVARLLLRRLVGPLTLWDAAEPSLVEWEASVTAGLLEGLAPIQVVASPSGSVERCNVKFGGIAA